MEGSGTLVDVNEDGEDTDDDDDDDWDDEDEAEDHWNPRPPALLAAGRTALLARTHELEDPTMDAVRSCGLHPGARARHPRAADPTMDAERPENLLFRRAADGAVGLHLRRFKGFGDDLALELTGRDSASSTALLTWAALDLEVPANDSRVSENP